MAQEINLGGTIYISSKHAAEKTGYTQDYIGQLARGGAIEAKRVSGMWYILEESLRNYKAKADQFVPTPPQGFTANPGADVSVSFDGKDYISTSRAAKLTGYNQDYIGQLARSSEILSRQVGNRWYVDRESLMQHKKEKDDLLAAVQVESVGLAKPEPVAEPSEIPSDTGIIEEETHFEYVREEAPLIPVPDIPAVEDIEPEPMPEFPQRKIATPVFEEYRSQPLHINREIAVEPALEPIKEPEPVIIEERREEITRPVPREAYIDPLDAALNPEVAIPIRVQAPEVIEEHVYIDEDPPALPRKKRMKGGVFAMTGIAVIAAVGTIAYIGTSLGFINLGAVISRPSAAQNAAVTNSVVENGSRNIQEKIRSLFSKELVYQRE